MEMLQLKGHVGSPHDILQLKAFECSKREEVQV